MYTSKIPVVTALLVVSLTAAAWAQLRLRPGQYEVDMDGRATTTKSTGKWVSDKCTDGR
jgi:hypothetical protein